MQFTRKELIQVCPILGVSRENLLQLLNPDEVRQRAVQDHVPSDQTQQQVEVHDQPGTNRKHWGHLVAEEDVHVVQQV